MRGREPVECPTTAADRRQRQRHPAIVERITGIHNAGPDVGVVLPGHA